MSNTEVVHLHDDTSSIVITLTGASLPVVTHWGRTLGDLDQTALRGLVGAVSWTNPNNAPDDPVPLALLPDAACSTTSAVPDCAATAVANTSRPR